MRTRTFGRLGWGVSEVGHGMWGLGGGPSGWTGATREESDEALVRAVELGCNFFDTAWIYGRGQSELALRRLKQRVSTPLYAATKVPPKDRAWPPTPGSSLLDVYPQAYVAEYVERSMENLGVGRIDLLQFHTWEDRWAADETWMRTVENLKADGLIEGFGISVNRWEPWNVVKALETGLVDAVQVIYNIFDQAPEDELFSMCQDLDVAVIARVPFDEGSLTGTLTPDPRWAEGDWRHSYFVEENLRPTLARVAALQADLPPGADLPGIALRFILEHPAVATVIPGMRRIRHVEANMCVSDWPALGEEMVEVLRRHRWDRRPTWWSQ